MIVTFYVHKFIFPNFGILLDNESKKFVLYLSCKKRDYVNFFFYFYYGNFPLLPDSPVDNMKKMCRDLGSCDRIAKLSPCADN